MDTSELRRFRLLYTTYPQIRELVTPESSPSQPDLLQWLSFSHLTELLELSRHAVEMPKKQEVERFLKEIGKEVGYGA